MSLQSDLSKKMNARAAAKGGNGVAGLAGAAVEDVKRGLKSAGELHVADEILDALTAQLVDKVPQIAGLPPVVTRALTALALNALVRTYGDQLPFDGKFKDVLREIVEMTSTSAFYPLFKEFNLLDMLKNTVASVTGVVGGRAE